MSRTGLTRAGALIALAAGLSMALQLRAEPMPPTFERARPAFRLVEPGFDARHLQHATLRQYVPGPPRAGPTMLGVLYGGAQHFAPKGLLHELGDNGYDAGAALTPTFGFMLSGGGMPLHFGVGFGGATVDIDDGEVSGNYYYWGFMLQGGFHVTHEPGYALFPLAGIGFGQMGVNASTTDPMHAPILRGQFERLPDGFALRTSLLLLELGGGVQTIVPLTDSGHGVAVELQVVYAVQPLSPDWSGTDGRSLDGPSASFDGLLVRLGVGWGLQEIQRSGEAQRVALCAGPSCQVMCDAGYLDCDGEPRNGCETRGDDMDNCGGCGLRCALDNAAAVCRQGRCELSQCAAGFASCDGDEHNGCESDTQHDQLHCGACDSACAADEECVEGICSRLLSPDAGEAPASAAGVDAGVGSGDAGMTGQAGAAGETQDAAVEAAPTTPPADRAPASEPAR